jgi:hypothetical protein
VTRARVNAHEEVPMATRHPALAVLSLLAALAACTEHPLPTATPPTRVPTSDVINPLSNGVIVEVGEHSAPFGLINIDPNSNLVLYYRWDNGFCGGVTPSEFILSTYRDVIRVDETWQTLDKTHDFWFYVYEWNGNPFLGCNFLKTHTPLATGRGRRLLHDNDFYPFDPYGPGPGANAYLVELHGDLTTAAGTPTQFAGQIHATVDRDGETVRLWNTDLRLSPDPRQ